MSENPAAFPCTGEGHGNPSYWTPGMSLRDWFAGQALAGILKVPNPAEPSESAYLGHGELAAFDAYTIADAMLAERENNRAR